MNGHIEQQLGFPNAQEVLDQDEVARAADRQELSQSLHNAK